MRILIVSDTHGRNQQFLDLVEKWKPLDMVVHCGDVEGSEYLVSEAARCKTVIVQGNNDYFSDLPREAEIKLENYRMLVTHGHSYYVNMGNERLVREAKKRNIQIVVYGHTHRPVIEKEQGVLVLNPGSLSYPRQKGARGSYIIMEINKNVEPVCGIYYL